MCSKDYQYDIQKLLRCLILHGMRYGSPCYKVIRVDGLISGTLLDGKPISTRTRSHF